MRIGLEREQRAADRLDAGERLRGGLAPARDRRRRRCRALASVLSNSSRFAAHQGCACAAGVAGLREQLFPGRAHDEIARQRPDQQFVQLLDQPVALVLVHDEREVEIVGRLADQVHLLLFEQRERVAELVQDGADVAADQRHARRRAR